MEDMLSSVLETGEEVLWRGKPETFETLDKTHKPVIVKGEIIKIVVSLALIIAYIVTVNNSGAGVKPGIIVIILAILAYALASPFLHANTLRRKVEYVITNQRLITIKDEAKGVEFDKIKRNKKKEDVDQVIYRREIREAEIIAPYTEQYKSQYTDGVKRTIDFRSAPNVTNDCYFFRFAEKDGSKTVIIVEVVAKMVDRFKYSNKEATVVSEVSR